MGVQNTHTTVSEHIKLFQQQRDARARENETDGGRHRMHSLSHIQRYAE